MHWIALVLSSTLELLEIPLSESPTDRDAFLEAVSRQNTLILEESNVPDSPPLTLELGRLSVSTESVTHVDAEPVFLEDDLTLWQGRLAGMARSEVFLALSTHGSWGWIETGSELYHLVSRRSASGTWIGHRAQWLRDDAVRAENSPGFLCQTEPRDTASSPVTFDPSMTPQGSPPLPVLRARIGFETDYPFFELFGDVNAARTYVVALIGALNMRYRDQVGAIIDPVYLGFHTDPDDGWDTPDNPSSSCLAVLSEFRRKWRDGQAPVEADLYHLMSGSDILGGCASIDVLCNQRRAFGVTLGASGETDFPVVPSPLNYDFVIVAHEIAHNFGAIHTHETCPPIDECAQPPNWGPCQDETACTDQGTLMSYCGQCPGGFENHTTWFHPFFANMMRERAEASCLEPFAGVLVQDLGASSEGSVGTPTLHASWDNDHTQLAFNLGGSLPHTLAILIAGLDTSWIPFRNVTMVPTPELIVTVLTDSQGGRLITGPIEGSHPEGLSFFVQGLFVDLEVPGEFSATSALNVELITP